jgi:hypothetical protein
MSEELRALINGAMTELDPQVEDNQPQVDSEALDDSDYETEESVDLDLSEADEADEDMSEGDEELEEQDDESADTGETHTVKVNGEVLEVTLDELKSGYQRQADYTREKQALKRQVEEFEQVRETLEEAYDGIQSLEEAWEENPVTVLAQFTASTENPTHAVALLIKELAAANMLDREFLDMFGVTPDIQRQWAAETRSMQAQQEQKVTGSRREQELAKAQEELEIQKAIAEYDRQIDEILDAEGLDFTVKQRAAFREELAKYAAENELTNLKAAYKAFKYEESQKKKKAAAKTVAKAQEKKAARAVTRSGAGADGSKPVTDSSDLQSVIMAAMKDTQQNLK